MMAPVSVVGWRRLRGREKRREDRREERREEVCDRGGGPVCVNVDEM